jgi:hypothetical protein
MKTELITTSSAKKMEAILTELGQVWRGKSLVERFNALPEDERRKPAIVYDIWEQPELGTVALVLYSALDRDNELALGNELYYSRDGDAVREAVKQVEDNIWMPMNLLASREDQERFDREEGITR